MSFPRYPKYKGSGVEWLGEVPEHWDVMALKRITYLKSGDSITGETIEETGDAQTAEAERAIELLQERRTALISAAVTGKIDVREFAESEPIYL